MGYGDMLRLYMTPDFSAMYSLLMLLDQNTGITNRINKTRWLAIQAPEGGYNNLLNRISVPWGNAQVNQWLGALFPDARSRNPGPAGRPAPRFAHAVL